MKNEWMSAAHGFPPLKDAESRILILGSFPSVLSRKASFFYMHPQNRFYKVLGSLFRQDFYGASVAGKASLLHECHIALYDVVESCRIVGSSDASIREVVPSDLEAIIEDTKIGIIFCNGTKAYELFWKFHPGWKGEVQLLPSTSSANARMNLEALCREWSVILRYCFSKDFHNN